MLSLVHLFLQPTMEESIF